MIGVESGMGLGSFGGFAPTPEQIQERLGTAGIPSYTPPRPASVAPPTRISPTGSMQKSQIPTGRGTVPDDYDYGSRQKNQIPTTITGDYGSFQGRGTVPDDYDYGSRSTPTTPKPTPVLGSSAPPELKSRAPKPAPVTPPSPVTSAPLPEGVQSGGRYYKNPVTGDPMYQPPMPKLPDGMMGAQVMPTPINLNTGKPENIFFGDKPAPVTPPNRVGQPVSAGEFIPEPTPVTPTPKPKVDPVIAADTLKNMRAMTKNMTPEQLRGISTYAPELAKQLSGPTTPKSAIQSYKDTLLGAADKNVYDVIDDVDEVDDFYDMAFRGSVLEPLETSKKAVTARDTTDGKARGSQYLSGKRGDVFAFTPDEYISEVGAPEYLKGLKSGVGADKDVIRSAYSSIANTGGADTAAALSNHYGFDVVPSGAAPDIKNFGGNYEEHTNASQEQISEFQSLIKPVLAETIPYLQATEGLDYQDALLEAYKRDPMVQSMYVKYGVQPVRQTKDGSTYLYDPMTFGEIRTKEVKDSSVKDALKVAAIVGLSVFGGGALAGTAAFGGGTSAVGSALAYGTTSAGITAATGGDTNDILKSFALAGVGGFAKGLNANAAGLADKARQGAFTLGAAAPDPALIEAANAAAKTADTFGKVVQGAKFIDAAVDGNIAGATVAAFGPKFTKTAMDKVGLDEKFLDGYNINQDDAVAGLVKTQVELTKGTDFGDAIARGFGEYIMEGGALAPSNVKTPEFIKMIGDAIRATGSMFDDVLLQPIKGAVEPVIDAARDIGSAADDAFIQPVREGLKVVDDAAIQPIKEGFETVYESIPNLGVDLSNLPDVNLPASTSTPTQTASRTPTPTYAYTPGIIEERGAELFDLGEREERGIDDLTAYLTRGIGMANGGVVRSSYGNLDELLRIVGGR